MKSKANCPSCADHLFTEKHHTLELRTHLFYKRRWTEEEDQIIEAGRRLGKTYKQIASELEGRTSQAVQNRLQRKKEVMT
ncbi:SANT/Myb-like DNA-binding domain-containing protein [Gracilibacillus sp. YIM 98692]|uniref:SANT/Myb-like DNA-binding domain-containing protein n=1 Tax=Gracilibacillus sp. YIM 98692 TaxID=2663532 RepID=UPI00196A0CB1|nr:SANT/Myb-like DNA-binding domain-containing protein [Gracilibacillus sp. YIM 98692]